MIIIAESNGIGISRPTKLAERETFAEAWAYVEAMNPLCLEADPDHADCADAFLADGRILTIQPHDFRIAA